MKKIYLLFNFIMLLALTACEIEEMVTDRDYPYVKTLGLTENKTTGAVFSFDVPNAQKYNISAYGLEYNLLTYFKSNLQDRQNFIIENKGKPSSFPIDITIDSDLQKDQGYLIRPFVKVGDQFIYGDLHQFISVGLQQPEVDGISQRLISNSTTILVTGKRFTQRLINLKVEIPGLENYFSIIPTEVDNNGITFELKKISGLGPILQKKFNLKISIGERFVEVPEAFEIESLKVEELKTNEAFIGDQLTLQTNSLDTTYPINFRSEDIDYPLFAFTNSNINGAVTYEIPQMPPGEYEIYIVHPEYAIKIAEKFKILNAWTPTIGNGYFVGSYHSKPFYSNNFLYHMTEIFPDLTYHSIDISTGIVRELTLPVKTEQFRQKGSFASDKNGNVFVGLGFFQEDNQAPYNYLKDYYKYQSSSGTWTKLPDYPFGNHLINFSFFHQNKIYHIVSSEANYITFDPQINQWSKTNIPVKAPLASSYITGQSDGNVYFTISEPSIKSLYSYNFNDLPSKIFESQYAFHSTAIIGQHLFHTDNNGYFSHNLNVNKTIQIQHPPRNNETYGILFNDNGIIKAVQWDRSTLQISCHTYIGPFR